MKVNKTTSLGWTETVVAQRIVQLADIDVQRARGLPTPGLRLKMLTYQVRQAWTKPPFGKTLSNLQLKV